MNKIKIKFMPTYAKIALVALSLMMIVFNSENERNTTSASKMVLAVVMLLFIAGLIAMFVSRTVVEFGEGSIIKCRWMFFRWNIDLDKVDSVMYKLQSHRTKGGVSYSFDLLFYGCYANPKKAKKIGETLDYRTAEHCIQNRYEEVEIMKLYRYIENNYYDKAKGQL